MISAASALTSARKTSKRDVHRSVELLGQVEAPLIGAVLNDVSSEAAYGYGYQPYGYPDETAPLSRRARRKAKRATRRVEPVPEDAISDPDDATPDDAIPAPDDAISDPDDVIPAPQEELPLSP